MPFKVIVTKDFDHMSEVAANIVIRDIKDTLNNKDNYVLGLATGNTPTGLYKHLAKAANAGAFDCSKIRSFNLDEYIGLPGENAQQRALHPESYSFFMVQELFGLLEKKFGEVNVPWGTLVDQERLLAELGANPGDWEEHGADKGRAILIKTNAQSEYFRWIRKEILDAYGEKIERKGGIDLHVVGVGGRGHVAFHESGIPFEGNKMLLVKLDEDTVANAVKDGHFPDKGQSPWYAISMGAELVYSARTVILLANGDRKAEPVAESLLNDPTPLVPISYGQIFSGKGGNMIYVIDKAAAKKVLENADRIGQRGVAIKNVSAQAASKKVEDLTFFRNPDSGLIG
ncbi:MAG: 6-phosphogluconolactonase [Deltaproteobacteria bacterium]|nr:MAG: 6-phosphogluconolactonase [Deltaproteobacteria bacterium]